MTPPHDSEVVEFRVLLARFEEKLDQVIRGHGDHLKDLEARTRVLEAKKTVTTGGLLAAAAGVVTVLVGFVAFVDRLSGVA